MRLRFTLTTTSFSSLLLLLILGQTSSFQVNTNKINVNLNRGHERVLASFSWPCSLQSLLNNSQRYEYKKSIRLYESLSDEEITTSNVNVNVNNNKKEDQKELTHEELTLISKIAQTDSSSLDNFLLTNLPNIPTHVITILRNAADGEVPSNVTDDQASHMKTVGKALVQILDTNLEGKRDLLKSFLECGEIRKLDSAIGSAMREEKLDMGFFTVLNMNLRDAAMEQLEKGSTLSPTAEGDFSTGDSANRYQILQHIYTRCQEEVEKNVSPGSGLLNKLLRTDQQSIRVNQLRHYLCPQEPKTISTPDGKSVELPGSDALVKPSELIEALQNAVRQIRTVEKSGSVDRAAAVGLVESCRQVAIEARSAIGEGYGSESEELKDFSFALQPVFRPESTESEYIKGVSK